MNMSSFDDFNSNRDKNVAVVNYMYQMVQRRQQRLYWQFRQHRLWQCGMYVCVLLLQEASFTCNGEGAWRNKEDGTPDSSCQGNVCTAPEMLTPYTCWLGIISYGTNTSNVCPATLVECVSNWTYMIPIVFAARAISPQMICTIPTKAATCLMGTIMHKD